MKVLIIEGGSSAYGMHARDYGGWAAQLHRDAVLANEQRVLNPVVVTNHAVPGFTLTAINKRFLATNTPARYCHTPDGTSTRILSVGINEAKIMPGMTAPIINLQRFAAGLAMFSDHSSSIGMKVLYVGPQPVDESKTRPSSDTGVILQNDLIEQYAGLMRNQAALAAEPFIDVQAAFRPYPLEAVTAFDGRHPNSLGHQLIYHEVRAALGDMFTA